MKSDSIEIYFFVGESHYKKEINISNQQGAGASSLSPSEKRYTSPLPVFHGNPKTSEFLFFKPNLADLTPNFFYDAGSNSLKNGREDHTLPETFQVHKKTEFSGAEQARISENFIELYGKGLSLADISRNTGIAKNTIRAILLRAGIELRSNRSVPVSKALTDSGKRNIRPYYGFCYFQGAIAPDQREFENLALIHQLWSLGTNSNRIADVLNEKKIPARAASKWNRNSIVNIITRFENKQIILLKGGKYELR